MQERESVPVDVSDELQYNYGRHLLVGCCTPVRLLARMLYVLDAEFGRIDDITFTSLGDSNRDTTVWLNEHFGNLPSGKLLEVPVKKERKRKLLVAVRQDSVFSPSIYTSSFFQAGDDIGFGGSLKNAAQKITITWTN